MFVESHQGEGDAVLIRAVAQATADGLATVADQMEKPGGTQAANLRVAENYLEQFGKLAKEGNTMILPRDAVITKDGEVYVYVVVNKIKYVFILETDF